MDRILVVLFCLLLGATGSYLYFKDNKPVVGSQFITISKPQLVNKLIVSETTSTNTTVVVKQRTKDNNPVFLSQWLYKVNIGVDFTKFDWSKVSGIGSKFKPGEKIVVSGTIPDLAVLDGFTVSGSQMDKVLSRTMLDDEEKDLRPVAQERKESVDACVQDNALYQQAVLEHAMKTVVLNLSAAMPVDDQGNKIVQFDLHFANEADLKAKIAQANDASSKVCNGLEFIK